MNRPGPLLSLSIFFLLCGVVPATAAPDGYGLQILPSTMVLAGPHAQQRVIVEAMGANGALGDQSHDAVITSSNPKVVRVDRQGCLHPVSDGAATIKATIRGLHSTAQVRVTGCKQAAAWSFRNDVLPVLTKAGCNGGSCHGAAAGKGGLKLSLRGFDPQSDYEMLTHQANGRRVVPHNPLQSLLLLKPTMRIPHGGGRRIEPGSHDEAVLFGWIAEGAPAPSSSEKRIESLEVYPPVATVHPGGMQQVLVTAHYSDGTSRDVTPLVKFGSVDGVVAGVSDNGVVRVTGRGETAITVWYSSKVNYGRIVSPYPRLPATVGVQSTDSIIDTAVGKKLGELNIPASPICCDGEFLRRASLDAAGALPTLAQTKQFLADTAPDKRMKVVDRLLASPEYADYWSYKWSDLLLLNSRSMPGESLNAFYGYIHKSVEQNKPWDEFVRQIITARGSTLENGAAAFFVIHKDPFDLTETTTQAFMGLSLMCAHCHNHPMEKWTQRDYYQMANLYARVRLKNGDKPGEVLVLAADSGDIPHPRLGTPLAPKPLDSAELRPDDPTDRRVRLADWLTSRANPAFARSIVNRVWRNFMGRGIVEAEDDLRATNPPTNVPLMEALTKCFIDSGYDVKSLIRQIMLSDTYQRSSTPVGVNSADDRYYSHYIVRRLPAEPLLDAIAQVTEVPTMYKDLPKGTRALQLKDNQVDSYFLTAFGRPVREKTCACERQRDPDVAQALDLSNGDVINARLRTAGSAVDRLVKTGASDKDILETVYLTALCRYPSTSEEHATLSLLPTAASLAGAKPDAAMDQRRAALEDLYWAVLTSREFVFNH